MSRRSALVSAVVVVVVVVASTGFALRARSGSTAGDVPLFTVERGTFERTVWATGNLRPAEATPLGPPPQVRQSLKIAWLADDGTPVRKDEVVIRFDPSELEESLRRGRHERDTSQARIDQRAVRDGGKRQGLELDSEMAGLELEYAERFQSRDVRLFSRTQIVESEIDRDLALLRKEHAEATGEINGELSRTELDLLAIERRKAELAIRQAEEGLTALEVRAPHDGIFVMKSRWGRKAEVGQMVWGGQPIAELPRLDTMEAEVFVLEADAGGLVVDLPVEVTLEARPGRTHSAKVTNVAALAQPRNRSSPVQYFAVTLALEQTDVELMKPGQRVRAQVHLERAEDALTVPRQAVFEDEGRKLVYVARGSGFEPVEVQLGTSGTSRVVVESGLESGDRVALRDPTRREEPSEDEGSAEQQQVAAP